MDLTSDLEEGPFSKIIQNLPIIPNPELIEQESLNNSLEITASIKQNIKSWLAQLFLTCYITEWAIITYTQQEYENPEAVHKIYEGEKQSYNTNMWKIQQL